MLYDADKISQAASADNEKDLYQSQLDIFLDPSILKLLKLQKSKVFH